GVGIVEPHSIVVDPNGTMYFTDGGGIFGFGDSAHRVMAFNPTTVTLSVLAGDFTGRSGTNDGTGILARFFNPAGIILARGGLVVADSGNHAIRYVGFDGVVTNIAGAPANPGLVDATGAAARFNTPIGLAVDSVGNIFVADSKNDRIRRIDLANVVTTVATGFKQPNDVVVGDNGELWVADTLNHQIKLIESGGNVVVRAGQGIAGFSDAFPNAADALLSSPRSLFFMGQAGVLISDSGNHVVRRLFTNSATGTFSIETSVGAAGEAGFVNGEATAGRLNSPRGITADILSGAFLVVDSANRGIRRIQQTAALPPVSNPRIGYVVLEEDTLGNVAARLVDVVHQVFNNEVPIQIVAESGVSTFYTFANTPTNVFIDTVPDPTSASIQATSFTEGGGTLPGSIIANVLPDMTLKAQSSQGGRVSSSIISSRFQFKAGNPEVVGDNAAAFSLNNVTTNAQMFYTIDGTEPTEGPPSLGPITPGTALSFNITGSNLLFKAQAFKSGFESSAVVSNLFSATDFTANRMTFGFSGGVASSAFEASSGSTFYAPITLSLVDVAQLMMSLQFSVLVTNDTGPAVTAGGIGFDSSLYELLQDGTLIQIQPAKFTGFFTNTNIVVAGTIITNIEPQFADLRVTNSAINLLSVGFLEVRAQTNLFNTTVQFLNSFSLAHDTLFSLAGNQSAVVGGFSFQVPTMATNGQEYRIKIIRPSATADGVSRDVFIDAPTNGGLTTASPISALKHVTVGSPHYMVGDVAPFRWWNAGDFGDTNLLNNDIISIFRTAVYNLNRPVVNSDFEDAMDACCGTATLDPVTGHLISTGLQLATNNIPLGSSTTINSAVFGSGTIDVSDVWVAFRRSLDPTLTNYLRFRSNGVHYAVTTPNLFRGSSLTPKSQTTPSGSGRQIAGLAAPAATERRVRFSVDSVVGSPGSIVAVPVRAQVLGNDPLRVLALNFNVIGVSGSDPLLPLVQEQMNFVPVAQLGTPTFNAQLRPNNYSAAWLSSDIAGFTGDNVIGHVTFRVPAGAGPNAAYSIVVEHASASVSGLDSFETEIVNGLVTMFARTQSTAGDGIPDEWRLRHFQAANIAANILSSPNADADGDGFLNWQEFKAGTNPNEPASALRMLTERLGSVAGNVTLRWPTILGKNYVVEYRDSLSTANWLPLTTQATGNGNEMTFNANSTGNPRFYRVRLVE
ncbi:MAG: chitobiase/beta-hexosaminidase C-terminal domain-containing protein, partial [Limisphaerales bacterium]